ncbi:hypothetical protein [Ligilactobacillus ceti]|uniref:Uncharacterized protein n=1 Tax=Ligilactobacillus ceti DSM 22408 TaxID=1122146 RepID=A0A0R2KIL2_9LACO|nr:hypothetical protein [Ligilactobacillus ceti]KRN89232.1 hypothetical protein IV53_GL000145 [Ligilactobacillus ceti DSM 22408]
MKKEKVVEKKLKEENIKNKEARERQSKRIAEESFFWSTLFGYIAYFIIFVVSCFNHMNITQANMIVFALIGGNTLFSFIKLRSKAPVLFNVANLVIFLGAFILFISGFFEIL